MRKLRFSLPCLIMLFLAFTACDNSFVNDDDGDIIGGDDDVPAGFTKLEGEVSGTLGPDENYWVTGDLFIRAGESLTIMEGTNIIIDGTGRAGSSPEINVAGSFYSYGTAEKPVYIGVEEEKRTVSNIFRGFWGGIIGTDTAEDIVFEYTTIEFAGAPAEAGSSIVAEGEIDEGEPRYAVYMVNPEGNFIMWHSRIAYTKDDAIRLNGAKTLIAYSEFAFNGETGGESVNTKSGVVGDFCYNVFYGIATNGLKAANSKGRQPQCNNNYYNNTIVGSGWRRSQAGRGGSLNYENGARGESFNNLVADCRYGLRLFPPDDEPDMANMKWGNHFYYGSDEEMVEGFHPINGIIGQNVPGYEGITIPTSDIFGAVGDNDPMFVGYSVGSYTPANYRAMSDAKFVNDLFEMFKLSPESPAITGGTTDFSPIYSEYVANGKTYTTPLPSTFFGAVNAD
ncbi:hypothetical protein MM239_12520 [Belliella sp. DSM 111904]|uniref:T9SS C-terminal target domain-containing protein n=1 Tax=Belliella filtrata TaxID=2923435 RepID=A0ABS9V1J9_9BACT|nr:hypothetical protein [Belliella filtrata]MCH7410224.1 hypothetical protein [Belliella filtrata]